ncbi:Gfo/Idh/MocA-like oxidoreductase N-terminal domain-containing protein [Entamoeba marina]
MSRLRVLVIGQGQFGSYITQNIIPKLQCTIVEILRSKDFSKIYFYAIHPELYDRIYIALPYELHHPVIQLFPENSNILCEKPVLGYESIHKVIIAYHRIHDRYFINAKLDFEQKSNNGLTPRVRIVSKDMGDGDDDSLEWLYCAMCHDLHMAAFISGNVRVLDVTIGTIGSDIIVELERGSRTYVQEVIIDNVVYGYDSEVFSETYEETYLREFSTFLEHGKVDVKQELLQKQTSQLLLDTAKMICKKKPNALEIHKKKYDEPKWQSENTKELLKGNHFVLPFEPIEEIN